MHFGNAVAEKLKAEGRQEIFRAEEMEELEDTEGNVYNRKVYNDLKTQGVFVFSTEKINDLRLNPCLCKGLL